MSDKYIIKNCPNLSHAIMADGTERNFQCGLEIDKYCQDCTNCVLKQIVSRLNNFAEDYGLDAGFYADELLSYLDIQEV